MKKPKKAPSYQEWLEAKVAAALAGIADGTNKPISEQDWQKIRAAWLREAKAIRAGR